MFSVNQNRQLYVVKEVHDAGLVASSSGHLTPGGIHFNHDTAGHIFAQYVNAKGEAIRTDIINPNKVNYIRRTAAADMIPKVRKYTIGVNADIQTDSKVPAGKHYILRLDFTKLVGISDEESGMVFGDYYTTTTTDAAALLKHLALSLAKNIGADKTQTKLAKIMLGTTVITAATKFSDIESVTGDLTVTEMAQDWARGKRQFAILPFTVSGNKITIDGVDVAWLATENGEVPFTSEAALTTNGKLVADLEWFCAGEKGDQYRGINWPNNIDTEYMVDPETNYDMLDISYFYSGDNEDIQHSSKVMTFVGPTSVIAAIAYVLTPASAIEEGTITGIQIFPH